MARTLAATAAAAVLVAAPPSTAARLPWVPPLYGHISVSPARTLIRFTDRPSSSAAICAKVVSRP